MLPERVEEAVADEIRITSQPSRRHARITAWPPAMEVDLSAAGEIGKVARRMSAAPSEHAAALSPEAGNGGTEGGTERVRARNGPGGAGCISDSCRSSGRRRDRNRGHALKRAVQRLRRRCRDRSEQGEGTPSLHARLGGSVGSRGSSTVSLFRPARGGSRVPRPERRPGVAVAIDRAQHDHRQKGIEFPVCRLRWSRMTRRPISSMRVPHPSFAGRFRPHARGIARMGAPIAIFPLAA